MQVKTVSWEKFTEFFGVEPREVFADSIRSVDVKSVEGFTGQGIQFETFVRTVDGVIEIRGGEAVRRTHVVYIERPVGD